MTRGEDEGVEAEAPPIRAAMNVVLTLPDYLSDKQRALSGGLGDGPWKPDYKLLAQEFADNFFFSTDGKMKVFKQRRRSPANCVFDPSTASYVHSSKALGDCCPAGNKPSWAFWDHRIAAWREKMHDMILIEDGATYFGRDKTQHPLRTYSITISMKKGDTPTVFVNLAVDYFEVNAIKYAVAVERGTKENNRHLPSAARICSPRQPSSTLPFQDDSARTLQNETYGMDIDFNPEESVDSRFKRIFLKKQSELI